jgi:hypothetical protein
MGSVTIELDYLRELLCEAYEAGWYGTKELKNEAIEKILEQHKVQSLHTTTFGGITPPPANPNLPPISFDNIGRTSMEHTTITISGGEFPISNESLVLNIEPTLEPWQNAGDG